MNTGSLGTEDRSITDSDGPRPPSNKDDALAGDVMELRRLLLRKRPEVQKRFRGLARMRPSGPHHAWPHRAGLEYYAEAERLANDLDSVWTVAEITELTSDPALLEDRIAGRRGIGLGLCLGRVGRGRCTTRSVLELVATSIALRAAGQSVTDADRSAAAVTDPCFPRDPETVALYRKRLRDRLK